YFSTSRGPCLTHAFPTRPASGLGQGHAEEVPQTVAMGDRLISKAQIKLAKDEVADERHNKNADKTGEEIKVFDQDSITNTANRRSEEHTSELQSREKLVCRLLLE